MKILLTGSNGMLASDVKQLKPAWAEMLETDVAELDITNQAAVRDFCQNERPEMIINCAAYTAVDKAETDQASAYAVNQVGPYNLAVVAKELDIPVVHISTDFVFFGDGSRPMLENDATAPKGVYAQSKRAGELDIEKVGGKYLVVRTSWLYGLAGKNFPDTMIMLANKLDKLTVVDDQRGSPTFSLDLAQALWKLIEVKAQGYVHFSNSGDCSWYGFAVEAINLAKKAGMVDSDKELEILPVTSAEFVRPAPRPAYSVMSTEKYSQLAGEKPRSWQVGLADYITKCSQT